MSEPLYTVDETSKILRTSKRTLYRLMRSGALKYRKTGAGTQRGRLISQSDIDRYIADSLVESAPSN